MRDEELQDLIGKLQYVVKADCYQMIHMTKENAHYLLGLMDYVIGIEALIAEEGNSVNILCDNPEGPNAIQCVGEWTGWEERRIEGKNTVECLARAVLERNNHV